MAEDEAARFWEFSLAIYADPDVAAAALALQETQGLDVNLALFCLFQGFARGRAFDRATLSRLATAAEQWNEVAVRSLRSVRRRLRAVPDAAVLRQAVAAAELEAERVGQARLLAAFDGGAPAESVDAAWRNLFLYAGEAGRPLFAAAASRLAGGLAPAPDGPGIEAEEIEEAAQRVVDHVLDRGGPRI